jgi:hypothetical protein
MIIAPPFFDWRATNLLHTDVDTGADHACI